MTYSSMANFQGEGGVDTAPKKEKVQVASISNDYSNYSYTPEEDFFTIADPSEDYKVSEEYASNLYTEEQQRAEEFTGLGARPVTPTPISGGDNTVDDTQSNAYLTDVTTNLVNAASGSISTVKKFFGYEDKDTDKDYDVVYDEYVELYMPPELKAKNVPLGPKGVLSNYVPYVTTYNIGGEGPVIPQESLVDSRGEFPYTDDYRAKVKAILDADVVRRQAILDDAELIKKSDELGISTQKALELYYDSISSSVAPTSPAFERFQVADSGSGFESLLEKMREKEKSELNKYIDSASKAVPTYSSDIDFNAPVETPRFLSDDSGSSRKGNLKDLATIFKPIVKDLYKSFKGEGEVPDYSISSTTEENVKTNVAEKEKVGGLGLSANLKRAEIEYTTEGGFNYSLDADYNGNAEFSIKKDNLEFKIDKNGNAYIGLEFTFGGAR